MFDSISGRHLFKILKARGRLTMPDPNLPDKPPSTNGYGQSPDPSTVTTGPLDRRVAPDTAQDPPRSRSTPAAPPL